MSTRLLPVTLFSATLIGLISLAGWSFAQRNNSSATPAELLPAETVFYARIDGSVGHEEAFEETAAYQALYDSGLMDLLNSAMSSLQNNADTEGLAGVIEHLQQYGFSLSIAVDAPEQAPMAAWGTIVVPFAAEGTELLQEVIESSPNEDLKVQRTKVKGRQVRFIDLKNPLVELGWWAEGSNLVLAFGMNAISHAIDVADQKRQNITTHPLWKKFSKVDDEFDVTQHGWLDFASLRKKFSDVTIPLPNQNGRPSPTVGEILQVLGLSNLNHFAFLNGYRGESLWSEVIVDAPGERTGLLSLMDQETFTLEDLPAIPLHHLGLVATSFNAGDAYATFVEIAHGLADFGPQGAGDQIDSALANVEQELGFAPEELLKSIGSLHCFYSDSSQSAFGLGTVGLVAVEDQKTLTKCLRKLFERIATEVNRNQQEMMHLDVTKDEAGTVFQLSFPKSPFVTPTISVGEEWMIVGLMPQAVTAQQMRMDGDLYSWSIDEDLAEAFELLPEEFTSLKVVDPAGTYRLLLGLAPTVLNFVELGLRESKQVPPNWEMPISVADIPPAELVVQDLFMNVAVSAVEEEGLHIYARQSLPGLPLLGGTGGSSLSVGTIGIGVALLLPAVQSAREAARRSQSKNNLKQLGLAMHNYHDVHGHFPEGTIPNENLKPEERLSWVVSVLPFLDQAALYEHIDRKSGWEAEDNKQALSTRVPVLMNPSQSQTGQDAYAMTHYIGIAGVGKEGPTLPVTSKKAGVFAYDRGTKASDIRDGMSNTVMLSDASEIARWGEGGPATIRPLTKKPYINGPDGIGSPHTGGAQMAFSDGAVRFISDKIDPSVMEALSTINGGEVNEAF